MLFSMRVARSLALLSGLLAVVLAAAMSASCARPDDTTADVLQLFATEPEATPAAEVTPPPPPSVGLLDGVPFGEADAMAGARPPVAVMIDNLPGGSRPQIGLDRADLVYELLVEGGITRFMAVYLHHDADVIEPV